MVAIDSPLHIRCGNEEIEQVVEFRYLGSIVKNMGSTYKEIMTTIGQANTTFNRLKFIRRSKNYSTKLKLHLFNSNIIPVLFMQLKS